MLILNLVLKKLCSGAKQSFSIVREVMREICQFNLGTFRDVSTRLLSFRILYPYRFITFLTLFPITIIHNIHI